MDRDENDAILFKTGSVQNHYPSTTPVEAELRRQIEEKQQRSKKSPMRLFRRLRRPENRS